MFKSLQLAIVNTLLKSSFATVLIILHSSFFLFFVTVSFTTSQTKIIYTLNIYYYNQNQYTIRTLTIITQL